MAIQVLQILAPTTAGANSSTFEVDAGPVILRLSGAAAVLAGAETATLQYQDASSTWRNVVDAINGTAQLTAGETAMKIEATGTYRVVLTATVALTGLEIVGSYAG
jgi:hypothetical protein